ncbi:hypothetical protein [Alicyclobacillus fodiniaquatilis]|uniref:Uncharacterized protein n=1 Tax=Alicyclobacillus fodiniaquatilis TaxID=1661150 RepID=A0ABW4JCQ9_9BACL
MFALRFQYDELDGGVIAIGDMPDPEEVEPDGGIVETPFRTGEDGLDVVAAKEVENPVNNIVVAASVPIIIFLKVISS